MTLPFLSVKIAVMLGLLAERVLNGKRISSEDAEYIISIPCSDISELFYHASRIRRHFRGDSVDICAIINAKSGLCAEDCSYCAQSATSSAEITVFHLIDKERVIEKAAEAKEGGAKRFCIVTSGKKVSDEEILIISEMISSVRAMGLLPCATLGLLTAEELRALKDSGLERYHHNLETSRRFFPEICTTHTYQDKLGTIQSAMSTGLSLCSGGIFGLGETWQDRIDMAFALRDINPDSVPINFLMPIKGTRLGNRICLEPFEALKIISLYRFILPDREIRVCGGRIQTLGEFHPFIFHAGADSILSGNYLTTSGRKFEDDIRLIRQSGLSPG